MIESIIGFTALIIMVFLRLPLAFAMGVVGFIGFWYINDYNWNAAMSMAARRIIDTGQDYSLSVIPLFILMGNFVTKAGLSNELYRACNAFVGHKKGGLSMSTILACGGFSAICGSSLATSATMSKVAMPPMRKYGYSDGLAAASIAAGGTLGILIPPSVIARYLRSINREQYTRVICRRLPTRPTWYWSLSRSRSMGSLSIARQRASRRTR